MASTVLMSTLLLTCQRSLPTHLTSAPAVMLTRTGFNPASSKMSPTALPTPVSSMTNCAGLMPSLPSSGGRASRFFTVWTTAGYDMPSSRRCKCRQSMRSADACLMSSIPQWRLICVLLSSTPRVGSRTAMAVGAFHWPGAARGAHPGSRGQKTDGDTLSAKLIRHTSRHICGIGAWRLGFVASVSHVIPAATCNSLERKGNVCDKLRHENDLGHRTNTLILLERAKGIEPSTYSLGS